MREIESILGKQRVTGNARYLVIRPQCVKSEQIRDRMRTNEKKQAREKDTCISVYVSKLIRVIRSV